MVAVVRAVDAITHREDAFQHLPQSHRAFYVVAGRLNRLGRGGGNEGGGEGTREGGREREVWVTSQARTYLESDFIHAEGIKDDSLPDIRIRICHSSLLLHYPPHPSGFLSPPSLPLSLPPSLPPSLPAFTTFPWTFPYHSPTPLPAAPSVWRKRFGYTARIGFGRGRRGA
jgi:hypothetical protein